MIAALGTFARSSVRPSESTQRRSSLEPEREPERRVAERLGDRVAERPAVLERHHQPGDRAAREPAAQDPEQERERHEQEEDEEERAEDLVERQCSTASRTFPSRSASRVAVPAA